MRRLRAVWSAVTCMSCGVALGRPHLPTCMFNREN